MELLKVTFRQICGVHATVVLLLKSKRDKSHTKRRKSWWFSKSNFQKEKEKKECKI